MSHAISQLEQAYVIRHKDCASVVYINFVTDITRREHMRELRKDVRRFANCEVDHGFIGSFEGSPLTFQVCKCPSVRECSYESAS